MDKKILIIGLSAFLAAAVIFLLLRAAVNAGGPKPAAMARTAESMPAEKTPAQPPRRDTDKAIKDFEERIKKEPDSPQAESAMLGLASVYEERQDLLRARDIYQRVMEKFPNSNNTAKAQEGMERVNVRILFSPIATPDSFIYEVQKGDSLTKLAKRFNTTVELISKANGLKDANIRIGRRLKITRVKFSISVDKSQNILTLKADENVFKTYRVSTGTNFSTPTGSFKITTKIIDPPWYIKGAVIPAGSPQNILGSRWLGITEPRYGIHGTTEPQSIGKQVTAGCVRMVNSDVEELYDIVPVGTEVVIVD